MPPKPDECSTCTSNTNQGYAGGEGPIPAKIMFIGEACGEVEANEGRPFRGGTGKMLRMMIHQAGLKPHQYYITNVVKCRPPQNRTPTDYEISHCTATYLEKEIIYVRPTVIVPVGDIAMQYVLDSPGFGIQAARGYVFQHKATGTMVIPIVHPSFVARGNREFWAVTVYDLKKIKLAADGLLGGPPQEKFNLFPSIHDVRSRCQYILRNKLRVAFDIETIGEHWKLNLMCCGLAWGPEEAMCIPFLKRGGREYWSPNDELEAYYWLNEIFKSDCIKVGQNIFTFDIPKLMEFGFEFKELTCRDTLIRHHTIGLELPHSQNFLASVYTRLPHYKLDVKKAGGFVWAPDEIMRRYNLLDCIGSYQVDTLLTKEMVEFGILEDQNIA
jgi:DNA polymerase